MKIYGDVFSGNCYKIKLLTALLDLPHEWVPVDILARETTNPDFLRRNPVGQIPLLELDDGCYLSESNAILNYLAQGSPLIPGDPFDHARMLQWQFFEQYSHEPYIAVARFIKRYLGLPQERRADFESRQQGGYKALSVMETQLKQTPFVAGMVFTLADISLYGYTHVAGEGGFDLAGFRGINTWLERIESLPGYIPME